MNTHAVFRAMRALRGLGCEVLRFNFRGVGKSAGAWDEGRGELDDGREALRWLRSRAPARPLISGGFSFGSWVGMTVGVEARAQGLLGLGVPFASYDLARVNQSPLPKAFVLADHDEFTSVTAIRAAVERMADRQAPLDRRGNDPPLHRAARRVRILRHRGWTLAPAGGRGAIAERASTGQGGRAGLNIDDALLHAAHWPRRDGAQPGLPAGRAEGRARAIPCGTLSGARGSCDACRGGFRAECQRRPLWPAWGGRHAQPGECGSAFEAGGQARGQAGGRGASPGWSWPRRAGSSRRRDAWPSVPVWEDLPLWTLLGSGPGLPLPREASRWQGGRVRDGVSRSELGYAPSP